MDIFSKLHFKYKLRLNLDLICVNNFIKQNLNGKNLFGHIID